MSDPHVIELCFGSTEEDRQSDYAGGLAGHSTSTGKHARETEVLIAERYWFPIERIFLIVNEHRGCYKSVEHQWLFVTERRKTYLSGKKNPYVLPEAKPKCALSRGEICCNFFSSAILFWIASYFYQFKASFPSTQFKNKQSKQKKRHKSPSILSLFFFYQSFFSLFLLIQLTSMKS